MTGYVVVISHYMRRSTHTCKVDGILLSLGNGRRRGRCGREGRHFKRFRVCSEVFKSLEVVDLKMADQTNCGHDDKARALPRTCRWAALQPGVAMAEVRA